MGMVPVPVAAKAGRTRPPFRPAALERMAGSVVRSQDRAVAGDETTQRVNRGIRKATSRRAYRY